MNKIIRIAIILGMSIFVIMLLVVIVMASLEVSSAADIIIICLLSIVVIINMYMVLRLVPRKRIKAIVEIKQSECNEFEIIYQKLLEMYQKEESEYRKPIVRKTIREIVLLVLAVSTFVASMFFLNVQLMLVCLMSIVLLIGSLMIKTNARFSYLKMFNEKIVVGLIKLLDNNIECKDKIIESYEIFYGLQDNKKSSITFEKDVENEIVTNKQITDSNTKNKMKVFINEGVRAIVEAPQIIPATIIVENDIRDLNLLLKRGCEKIEMDSSEFEKIFSVYSDDSIIALQLLTSDIMGMLVEFEKTFENSMEFELSDNHIFFRFYKEDSIVPSVFSEDLNKEKLFEYYTLITAVRNICFKIYENVKEI